MPTPVGSLIGQGLAPTVSQSGGSGNGHLPDSVSTLIFSSGFESGYAGFNDVADNEITTAVALTGSQSTRIPNQSTGSKFGVLTKFISEVDEIGLRGYAYFSSAVSLPNLPAGGLHMWRAFRGSDPNGDFDGPIIDAGLARARIDFVALTAGGADAIYEPSPTYNPAAAAFTDRWVLWEVYIKLNTPGTSDGIVKWWIDNEDTPRVDISNGNFRSVAGAAFKINRVNFQSNVGGVAADWPVAEWWAVDDVEIWVP